MKLSRVPAIVSAMFLALGVSPSFLQAGCGECVWDDTHSYQLCLLGCPVGDQDCEKWECGPNQPGTVCGIGSPCGFALMAPILSTGTLAHAGGPDANVAADERLVRFIDNDGSSVYRVSCNAAIVQRSYPEAITESVTAITRSLSI